MLIKYNLNRKFFGFIKPEKGSNTIRLSAEFNDGTGKKILRIEDNEWYWQGLL